VRRLAAAVCRPGLPGRAATLCYSKARMLARVKFARVITLRIGRGKPRPNSAAASRRTPHGSRRSGRAMNGWKDLPRMFAGHGVPCPYKNPYI